MTSLKTSIKTITYLSDIGCLEIQGASLHTMYIGPHGHVVIVDADGNAETTVKNIAFNYIVRLA